jgi:outer membrane protein assembly factor BamB
MRLPGKRLIALGALLVILVLGGAAVGYFLYVKHKGGDIVGSPSVEFVTTDAPPVVTVPPATVTVRPVRPRRPVLPPVVWPTYGYGNRRLRSVASTLRPPFRAVWSFRGRSLLEFPPTLAYGRLTLATNHGELFSINARTGKAVWSYPSGRCAAASPAIANKIVYASFLNRPPCNSTRSDADGEVVAFDALTGHLRWRVRLGPTESSPLVANGLVYVGDWHGRVVALDAATGALRWSFATGGKVKSAAALEGNRLVIGSYDGHVYALNARTGALLWRASGQERFGSSGHFYATAALAFGRVYIGSTDGKVYSFGAQSGQLRWSQSTGGYVYASPAVWRQLVLVGSYSGSFYALDAATGAERWRFRADGPISGSAVVIGDVVYVSTLARRTYALDAATGKLLWTFPEGKYAVAIADAQHLYLVGYTRLYAMVPRR